MNEIEDTLKQYRLINNIVDYQNAIKEILQMIILAGLSKTDFFAKASFCGGTSLRIFHGLDRFSEDLDFTLNYVDSNFSFKPYFNSLKQTAKEYGFNVEFSNIDKGEEHSNISSVFLKTNAKDTMVRCGAPLSLTNLIDKDAKIKIKLEIDIDPPLGFTKEDFILPFGNNFKISVLDAPSLLAGKIHAVLYRQYRYRVKGRDYYDFIFLVGQNVPVNIEYIENKINKTDKTIYYDSFNLNRLKLLLREKINSIDIDKANEDLEPFVYFLSANPILNKRTLLSCVNKLKCI